MRFEVVDAAAQEANVVDALTPSSSSSSQDGLVLQSQCWTHDGSAVPQPPPRQISRGRVVLRTSSAGARSLPAATAVKRSARTTRDRPSSVMSVQQRLRIQWTGDGRRSASHRRPLVNVRRSSDCVATLPRPTISATILNAHAHYRSSYHLNNYKRCRPLTFELKIGSTPVTLALGNVHANFGYYAFFVRSPYGTDGRTDAQCCLSGLP